LSITAQAQLELEDTNNEAPQRNGAKKEAA
jgi:hypothetical protein